MAEEHARRPGAIPGNATQVDDDTWLIDLGFQGRTNQVVVAYLLATGDQLALIETGPTSTLPALRAGIEAAGFDPARVDHVLLSHIQTLGRCAGFSPASEIVA